MNFYWSHAIALQKLSRAEPKRHIKKLFATDDGDDRRQMRFHIKIKVSSIPFVIPVFLFILCHKINLNDRTQI